MIGGSFLLRIMSCFIQEHVYIYSDLKKKINLTSHLRLEDRRDSRGLARTRTVSHGLENGLTCGLVHEIAHVLAHRLALTCTDSHMGM